MSGKFYYQHHVFFCVNQRNDNNSCCSGCGAEIAQKHAKQRIKQINFNGKIRINKAGCLDRCVEGPVLVVYPEGIWYTYVDIHDIDEIIDNHLLEGKIVERLRI